MTKYGCGRPGHLALRKDREDCLALPHPVGPCGVSRILSHGTGLLKQTRCGRRLTASDRDGRLADGVHELPERVQEPVDRCMIARWLLESLKLGRVIGCDGVQS